MQEGISRQLYRELKQKSLNYELKNLDRLVLIPCSGKGGWYEMGENSALLYAYVVCPKLSIKCRMSGDQDSFYIQYPTGRVRIKNVDEVRERLKKSGYYKGEGNVKQCIIFQLTKGITQEEMERLRSEELERQSTNDRIVETAFIDPMFHQKLTHLSTRLHQTCPKVDKLTAASNGQRLLTLADGVLLKYYEMCDENYPVVPVRIWQEMDSDLREVLFELQVLSTVKLFDRKKLYDIGQIALEAREFLKNNIKKSQKWEEKHGSIKH